MAEGAAGPVGRPRAVRGDPAGGRARARAHARSSAPRTGTSTGVFADAGSAFDARLVAVDGARVATGRDFDSRRAACATERRVRTSTRRPRHVLGARAGRRAFTVRVVEEKPYTPLARRAVHDLDAAAGGAAASCVHPPSTTMRVAQRLYENGYITYMRTDSTTLSESAIDAARCRRRASSTAPEYVPDAPRLYTSKVKNAQEAHEAIRPAGDVFRTPGEVARELTATSSALYELIWKRTVASQMADARGQTVSVRLGAPSRSTDATPSSPRPARSSRFRGFLAAYEEGRDEDRDAERRGRAPAAGRSPQGDGLTATRSTPTATRRSRRPGYTEATLVKALEERGIGRPSTYASIIGMILDRGYVVQAGQALVPSWLAFAVDPLLEEHFGAAWSTTTSPPRWRRTSTGSPAARPSASRG